MLRHRFICGRHMTLHAREIQHGIRERGKPSMNADLNALLKFAIETIRKIA